MVSIKGISPVATLVTGLGTAVVPVGLRGVSSAVVEDSGASTVDVGRSLTVDIGRSTSGVTGIWGPPTVSGDAS